MLIHLENISKIYNGKTILDNISLDIGEKDRIGLVGVNGSGKTTLLRIICGDIAYENQPEPIVPVFSRAKNCRIGILRQDSGLLPDSTVYESAKSAFDYLIGIANRQKDLEAMLASPEIYEDETAFSEISKEYSENQSYFENNDGYEMDVNIDIVLSGMGFPKNLYERKVSTLSGGEKTRLSLAVLLLSSPNLLILDEPTNHLDFETVIWLEDYLKSFRGALLIVSHDRYFLDKLTDCIVDLEQGEAIRYKGNYTRFSALKKERTARLIKEYEAQQAELAKLSDFVDRNLVRASTSNMAKSRIKMIERIEQNELIKRPITGEKNAKLSFAFDIEPPENILRVKNIDIAVGTGERRKILCEGVSLDVRRGEKLAVIGQNGTGKSTFLKMLVRKLAVTKGVVEWNKNIKIAYFDQEGADLNPSLTVIEQVRFFHPAMTDGQIRSLLGLVRFTGENVFKQVKNISGGERAKLSFALMMLKRANVLILDEPTNHLDIASKEVLEDALEEYTGSIIFVSHDRYLLKKLAGRIMEITADGVNYFPYGYDKYAEAAEERRLQIAREAANLREEKRQAQVEEKKKTSYKTREDRAADAKNRARIKEIEAETARLESRQSELEASLSLPEITGNHQELARVCLEIDEIKNLIEELTEEWINIECGG
ncbi:MAG: ABC-F family ATP-binding cassette domain-containing protein [Ruminococcus sp.]|jgi:ATP-binding cassette subfamily F protein 3|nr:ABC-F family ATP-binding cassette domain-containing protein [Ruminococcus sp.]